MSSIRPWALWRRIQYAIGFFVFWGLVGTLIFFVAYHVPPNCFDKVLNGNETGIDCGGGCVQICEANILPPRVVWTDSFLVKDNQYNVVAYVENPNQTAGSPVLNYTFQIFRGDAIVGERKGKTVLPPNSVYPIFEGRVFTEGEGKITATKIIIEPPDLWLPSSVGRGQFRSLDFKLTGADTKPQLDAEIENTTLVDAENVEVVATIFNEDGVPVTASQTFIERIEPRSTEDIVFTWPNPIAKTVKNCVVPTDVAVAIDLSGSMNNDGDNPPQPVTKALDAASKFVSALRAKDQVTLITFASNALLVTPLTGTHEAVASTTINLTIDPAEETGFTNTVDAFKFAQEELGSTRHNPDARRVLVLLTDGLPTKSGDEDVVKETEETAKQVNDSGVEVYSIGLGENVDQQFIRNIASDINNAYFAPTGEELNEIYTIITSDLCEAGPTNIQIIAKPETNFAPLR